MSKLIKDYAQVEISNKVIKTFSEYITVVVSILNPIIRIETLLNGIIGPFKAWTNTILNRTGAPAHCWLLSMSYV